MSTKRWKSNLVKIPRHILERVKALDSDECVAACIVAIGKSDIQAGIFKHLGIVWQEDGLMFPKQVMPPHGMGKYSRRNCVGYEIIHRDLPKTSKTWSIDAPNYGDPSRGYHGVNFSRDVYMREFVPPKLVPIVIEHIGEDIRQQASLFSFRVEETLDRRSPEFEQQLLFNLNLLQENTGNHGVQKSSASLGDYLQTLYVNWEILPAGEKEETLVKILTGIKSDDPTLRAKLVDRYNFLLRLKPKSFIRGTNGFRSYFGAQFAEDLVVFENVEYGNAIYVMFDDWGELSKKTRIELLSSKQNHFERIAHTKTWKRRLGSVILSEMRKRQSLN